MEGNHREEEHDHHPQHHPQHQPHARQNKNRHGSSNGVVIYTVLVCLSCFYLQTQIFAPILSDKKAQHMSLLTYFVVFMCLWSYIQTIRIKNKVPILRRPLVSSQNDKFMDFAYSPTHNICQVCGFYKFPRVSHCSNCGQCIYKMDHHCIWTQTCIGYSNQKCFYLFCIYMTIGVLQFWYFTVRVLKERQLPIFDMMEPGVVILWVFTGLSAFFVGLMIVALAITHTLMVLTNFRTLDGMKTGKMCPLPFLSTQNDPQNLNIFDRGQIENIKDIFGSEWWLWWAPTRRLIQNDLFPQKMAPHPDRLSLMKFTNMYETEQRYCKYMNYLSTKIGTLFIGKKIRVNNEVFLIQAQSETLTPPGNNP